MRPPLREDLPLVRDISDAPPLYSRCQVTVREDSYQVANPAASGNRSGAGAPRLRGERDTQSGNRAEEAPIR